MKHSGFSLIELMVVVAIIAVLSAIAVPAYKQYITKVNQTSDIDYIHRLMGESIAYYNINGVFGNPSTGTASAGGFDSIAMPNDYEGNIYDLTLITSGPGATCDSVMMIAGINLPVGDQPDIPNDPILMYIPAAINDHGVFSRFCYYEYYVTGASGGGFGDEDHGKTMPGCVRISDIGGDLTDIDADIATKTPACQ